MNQHQYNINIEWTGNLGTGTSLYDQYSRSHTLKIKNKKDIFCSSDTIFRGEAHLHNPEDLFIYSLASCHMLWYLHLCADNGVIVTHYNDHAMGKLDIQSEGVSKFISISLNPIITIKDLQKKELAIELHKAAHKKCFIANSINCPIEINPNIQ